MRIESAARSRLIFLFTETVSVLACLEIFKRKGRNPVRRSGCRTARLFGILIALVAFTPASKLNY